MTNFKVGDKVVFRDSNESIAWEVISVSTSISDKGSMVHISGPGPCRSIREVRPSELTLAKDNAPELHPVLEDIASTFDSFPENPPGLGTEVRRRLLATQRELINNGAREYYEWLRAKSEHPLAHVNSVESFITDKIEREELNREIGIKDG